MNFFRNLLAPFVIVKREKLYIGWILYAVIFGMINLFAEILMGNPSGIIDYVRTGQFYTFSIALCAPFIVDMLLSIIVERKTTNNVHFLKYKIVSILITVILIIIMSFLWIGSLKEIIWIQILLTVFALFLSYYMFLILHMCDHKDLTEKFDDKEYLEEEHQRINEVKEKADELTNLEMKGDNILL